MCNSTFLSLLIFILQSLKTIILFVFGTILEGVCEVWLTSEDTGAYGIDIGVTIVDLLWKLVEVIPEGCMMRIGMTNPPYILQHLEVRFNFNSNLNDKMSEDNR